MPCAAVCSPTAGACAAGTTATSPRAAAPFIALNMAAIPKDLMESELFGHEKGAFTGAANQRRGRFEQADGGTLFLDEIGDMPADTQTRLLRVLADGEFYRVGGHTPVRVDVRIIAATHQDLETLVQAGKFREDLFHRLNVIRVHIPRLSDRSEDIPRLASFFMARAAPPMLPAWLVLTSTTRMFCNDTMSLSKKTSGKLTGSRSPSAIDQSLQRRR